MKITDDSLYCPASYLLWAEHPGDGSPASIVHKAYAREFWRERSFLQRLVVLLRFVTWPFIVLLAVVYFTAKNGREIARRSGRGVLQQIADQFRLAACHGVFPPWYYMFELYRDSNRRRARDYLSRYETKYNLSELLKRYVEGTSGELLNNKAEFAAICRDNGIPTPPIVGIVEDGRFQFATSGCRCPGETGVPEVDLFVKPLRGKGGRGALRFKHSGSNRYTDSDGFNRSAAELLEYLEGLSREKPYIVQHSLTNHPDILDLSGNALSCVRTMSCRNENGGFEVTNAVFRMALRNDTVVDGLHRGGIVSRVDVETGELGPATDLGFTPQVGWCERNPVTGVQIAGRVLPDWPVLVELARKAHAAFPYKVTVGWDIALTADGPVVVEGNGSPCVDIVQRVDEPMGATRFGQLYAHHVSLAVENAEEQRCKRSR